VQKLNVSWLAFAFGMLMLIFGLMRIG